MSDQKVSFGVRYGEPLKRGGSEDLGDICPCRMCCMFVQEWRIVSPVSPFCSQEKIMLPPFNVLCSPPPPPHQENAPFYVLCFPAHHKNFPFICFVFPTPLTVWRCILCSSFPWLYPSECAGSGLHCRDCSYVPWGAGEGSLSRH